MLSTSSISSYSENNWKKSLLEIMQLCLTLVVFGKKFFGVAAASKLIEWLIDFNGMSTHLGLFYP